MSEEVERLPVDDGFASEPASSPGFVPVETADGSFTFAHPVHGQTCHSRAGAWQEARERYAAACRLAARARTPGALIGGGIDLLDVGTGLGWNLAAALAALDGTGVRLRAVSVEHDIGVLRATLDLAREKRTLARDDDADRWHALVRAAFECALSEPQRAASSDGVALGEGTLRLLVGDASATLPALAQDVRFDAVFLDPFSPDVEPSLWRPEFLGEIARRMRPGAWLSTYSASMRVRTRLQAAGLRVGPGTRVGTKASGTIASPDLDPGVFTPRTARRLARRAGAGGVNSGSAGD